MRDKRYRTVVSGIGKSSARKLSVSYIFWKIENLPSSCRSSKYIAGKDIQAVPTETCDTSRIEIQKFATCKL